LGMIERQFHEPLECDPPTARVDVAPDFTDQIGIVVHVFTIAEPSARMKAKEHLQAARVLVGSL